MKRQPNNTAHPESEAERFKEFARKLVSVPKAEIDKKAEEYHKQRIAERKAARIAERKAARKPTRRQR